MNLLVHDPDGDCKGMIFVQPMCFPVFFSPCVHISTPLALKEKTTTVNLYRKNDFRPSAWHSVKNPSRQLIVYENYEDDYEFYQQEIRHGKCLWFDNYEGVGQIIVFGRKYNKKLYVE